MTSFGDTMATVARDMIAEFGMTISATVESPTRTYTAGTDTFSGATSAHAVKITPPRLAREYEVGSTALGGELVCSMAGLGLAFTPAPGMKLTVQTRTLTCLSATAVYAGDVSTPAIWRLVLRGGA